MAGITLNHVKKVYDRSVVAVKDFHIDIADGEFVVLVGPSGCGKSTTLRMIAGLEEVTEGEILIDDVVVNRIPPKDRDLSMVFQDYALYPHMTVYDNIAYGLKLRKVPKKIIDKKVKEAAEILEISDLLKRKPKALSGGQRQRVAIGRAIVRSPKAFLMDEPLSNLDTKLRNQMRAEIIQLRERISTTFVYVTHDQTEAMTLGDRIVIMKDGYVQQIGTPKQVYHEPVNTFVAGFIGSPQMNFLKGRLSREGDTYFLTVAGKEMRLSDRKCARLSCNLVNSQDVIVGIRPEHIELSENSLDYSGVVKVSEMMGSNYHLHVSSEDETLVMIVPENEQHDQDWKSGDELFFTLQTDRMHLFDPVTEQNLEWS